MLGGLRSAARRLRPVALGVAGGAFATATWSTQLQAESSPLLPTPASTATAGTWAWPVPDAGSTQLRIASYNVLSDSLCDAEFFDCCAPADVDNSTRLARIKLKLEAEMAQGSVICLQEISRNWAGELLPLYEKHGYGHMEACSGSAFGGYMGVSLAWPQSKFACEKIEAKKIGETVEWPQPKRTYEHSSRLSHASAVKICAGSIIRWMQANGRMSGRRSTLGKRHFGATTVALLRDCAARRRKNLNPTKLWVHCLAWACFATATYLSSR